MRLGLFHCYQGDIKWSTSKFCVPQDEAGNISIVTLFILIVLITFTEVIQYGLSPSFVYTPEDTQAEAGSTVTLFCGANGRDTQQNEPTITWLKDGNAIDFK